MLERGIGAHPGGGGAVNLFEVLAICAFIIGAIAIATVYIRH